MADQKKRQSAPPTKIGSYLVGNPIGRGGFGSVYKALDQQKGHFVAIKQVNCGGGLSAGDLGSIEVEINLLSKLKHRNIVKYIDSLRTDTHLNIVLEFVEGGALSDIIKKFGPFPETLCAIYTLQILRGLKFLHSQGVIHRDIKGANVLTTKTGLIKLADFGVATKLSEIDSSKRRVVGTPYWMAPETVEMSPPTPASDIWSVGSTVVEMVTEKPPYADLPQMSALYRIVSDPHPPLPEGFSEALDQFLLSCFTKNPHDRAGAAMLIEDHWIQYNKRHTVEFSRRMVSPKASNREVRAMSNVPEDEHEESEDSAAEEMEAFCTLTMGGGSDHLRQEDGTAGGVHSLAAVAAVAAELQRSDEPQAVHQKELQPEKRSNSKGRLHTASATVEQGKAFPDEMLPASNLEVDEAAAMNEEEFQAEVAAKTTEATDGLVGDAERTLEEHGYHFAFLDYYHQMVEAKPAGHHSTVSATLKPEDSSVPVVPEAGTERQASEEVPFKKASKGSSHRLKTNPNIGVVTTPRESPSLSLDAPLLELGAAGDRDRQRIAAEIKSLLASIRPFEEPDVLVGVCKRLTELLQQGSSNKDSIQQLVMQHGAVPIVEMLQVTDPTLLRSVLKVVNQIVDGNQGFQELFSMVGLIPGVIKFARKEFSRPLRSEAATFISRLCHSSERSLQMLVACGGLEAIVDLISHDYYHNRDLVWLALDAVNTVFKMPGSHNRDLCRILAKHGLCDHLCLLIDTLASDILDRAAQYLQVVVSLLRFFAKTGDAVVKAYMVKPVVLEGLIASLEFLQPELTVQICKIFKDLAQEPSVLNMMENVGVVPVLVCHMQVPKDLGHILEPSSLVSAEAMPQDACSQCLLALSNLCKLSRPRQEQAALAGIIPKLQAIIERQHALRDFAFVMLCDMTCASLATRRLLWAQGNAAFLVRSLALPEFQVAALEALVGWFGVSEHKANWCERLEKVLLKGPDFLLRILSLFRCQESAVFLKILDPLLKLVRISQETNSALANSHEFLAELVLRLQGGSQNIPDQDKPLVALASTRFNSEDCISELAPVTNWNRENGLGVRRLVSAQPLMVADDAVMARQSLLRLLAQLCQPLGSETIATMCQRYRLKSLMHHVLAEERRRQRVILCEIASQLLDMFQKASPGDLDVNQII